LVHAVAWPWGLGCPLQARCTAPRSASDHRCSAASVCRKRSRCHTVVPPQPSAHPALGWRHDDELHVHAADGLTVAPHDWPQRACSHACTMRRQAGRHCRGAVEARGILGAPVRSTGRPASVGCCWACTSLLRCLCGANKVATLVPSAHRPSAAGSAERPMHVAAPDLHAVAACCARCQAS